MTHNLGMILDDMYAAILAGDFDQLSNLVPGLEDARELAERVGFPDPISIGKRAERNALCLQAAIYGVKSARRRVADIAEAARGLTTYDRVGGKATLSATPPKSRRV